MWQNAECFVRRHINPHAQHAGEDGRNLAEHAQAQAVDGVAEGIGVLPRAFVLTVPAQQIFRRDHGEEDRGGEDDDLAGAHGAIVAEVLGLRAAFDFVRVWSSRSLV